MTDNNKPKEVGVYNPLSFDVSYRYTLDTQPTKNYTIPSREIVYFSAPIAAYLKKKLYTEIVNNRNLNGIALNADIRKKQAIFDEMEVK